MNMNLPQAIRPFPEFANILRQNGFAISPDQTIGWIEAIELLGPQSMGDIYRSARAMLAVPKDRQTEFDALFRAYFMGQTISAPTTSEDDDDEVDAVEPGQDEIEVPTEQEESEVGAEASVAEILSNREFSGLTDEDVLVEFSRRVARRLPRRKAYRRVSANKGDRFDMRKSLRDAVRRDGEVFDLRKTRRKTRQRPIVLLIDVSGSMKEQSENTMRFAHSLIQNGERVEVFTLGTRLTRVTRALSDKSQDRALEKAAAAIADFDGGTRIGDALLALLAVPRFAATLRGASVVVLSDGLERAGPAAMVEAVERISRSAWRLDWLSPLASDPAYEPKTEAMQGVLPFLTRLGDGSSIVSICTHVLSLGEDARLGRPHLARQNLLTGSAA